MATVSDNAKNVIQEGADMADQAITTVASKASSGAHRVKEVADEAVDAVDNGRDALENALCCTKDMVRAHPMATIAVVGAIAYLWGRMK